MEQYQRNNQFKFKSSWDNKPKREWKPRPPMPSGCQYYVEVRDGEDPMRAYRKIKKKIKDDKFFDRYFKYLEKADAISEGLIKMEQKVAPTDQKQKIREDASVEKHIFQ